MGRVNRGDSYRITTAPAEFFIWSVKAPSGAMNVPQPFCVRISVPVLFYDASVLVYEPPNANGDPDRLIGRLVVPPQNKPQTG